MFLNITIRALPILTLQLARQFRHGAKQVGDLEYPSLFMAAAPPMASALAKPVLRTVSTSLASVLSRVGIAWPAFALRLRVRLRAKQDGSAHKQGFPADSPTSARDLRGAARIG